MPPRRSLLSLLLLLPLGIGLAGAVLPRMRVDKPGAIAFLCLFAAMALGGRALWRRPGGGMLAVLAACLFMLPFAVIARGFGRIDMMALLFHAEFGTQGAGFGGLHSEILKASLALTLVCLALYFLSNLWGFGWRWLLAAAVVLVALNPLTRFTLHRMVVPPPPSDLAREVRRPEVLPAPAALPDLAIIYLEGLDRRFLDTRLYGDAYAPLHELEPEALTFLNIGQIAGTGWSLAGMVASQCGVPLLPRGLIGHNNFDVVKTFLPELTCLTDILAGHGYAMDYIVGGDEGFAGIDAFYRSHGLGAPFGLDDQRALYPPDEVEAALVGWVLDDQMTFDSARKRLPALIAGEAPFLQIVETIGPHGKLGYLSRRCAPEGRALKSRDEAAVVRCTAEDALAYVRDLQAAHAAAGRAHPLRIAILSDHLNHNADLPDVPVELYSANTVMLIGGPGQGRVNDIPGAMIDLYPTLLDWLGLARPPVRAGLGRSLLVRRPPTLAALYGIPHIDAMLSGDARLANLLWHGSE